MTRTVAAAGRTRVAFPLAPCLLVALALLAAVIAHHGEDYARQWAEGVKANLAVKPQGGDRDQVRSIWAGECDISLGNTYYMGQMLKDPEQQEWANSVRIEFPTFEDGGTHINVSGIAMTQAAPNKEEALQWLEQSLRSDV